MLTFFTTAKPFHGHSAIIQRNALESWRRLHSDVQIILFGNEEGAADVCRDLGLHHEPEMERSSLGAPRADYMFRQAQRIASHDLICYCNCDIVLTQDFRMALEHLLSWRKRFLMVGRRWDTNITDSLDFSDPTWEARLVDLAKREGFQRFYYNIDYFAFTRGLCRDMPELVVGRVGWDHWMVWKARAEHAAVVDVSERVCAVHQNHDYSSHPQGMVGIWHDEDAQRNGVLTEGRSRTIEDANFYLSAAGILPNFFYWLAPAKRRVRAARRAVRTLFRTRFWHPLLDATRSLRHAMGLRSELFKPLRSRKAARRHWQDQ